MIPSSYLESKFTLSNVLSLKTRKIVNVISLNQEKHEIKLEKVIVDTEEQPHDRKVLLSVGDT